MLKQVKIMKDTAYEMIKNEKRKIDSWRELREKLDDSNATIGEINLLKAKIKLLDEERLKLVKVISLNENFPYIHNYYEVVSGAHNLALRDNYSWLRRFCDMSFIDYKTLFEQSTNAKWNRVNVESAFYYDFLNRDDWRDAEEERAYVYKFLLKEGCEIDLKPLETMKDVEKVEKYIEELIKTGNCVLTSITETDRTLTYYECLTKEKKYFTLHNLDFSQLGLDQYHPLYTTIFPGIYEAFWNQYDKMIKHYINEEIKESKKECKDLHKQIKKELKKQQELQELLNEQENNNEL